MDRINNSLEKEPCKVILVEDKIKTGPFSYNYDYCWCLKFESQEDYMLFMLRWM